MIETRKADQSVTAHHGVVCSYPSEAFGYFGWPTVARMTDGTLVVAASGMRNDHICPFGRSVMCISRPQRGREQIAQARQLSSLSYTMCLPWETLEPSQVQETALAASSAQCPCRFPAKATTRAWSG